MGDRSIHGQKGYQIPFPLVKKGASLFVISEAPHRGHQLADAAQ